MIKQYRISIITFTLQIYIEPFDLIHTKRCIAMHQFLQTNLIFVNSLLFQEPVTLFEGDLKPLGNK